MRSLKILAFLFAVILLGACQSEPKIEDYSGLWAIDVDKSTAAMNKPKEEFGSKLEVVFSFDFNKKLLAEMKDKESPDLGQPFTFERQDAKKYLMRANDNAVNLEIIDKDKIILNAGDGPDKIILHLNKISDTPKFEE